MVVEGCSFSETHSNVLSHWFNVYKACSEYSFCDFIWKNSKTRSFIHIGHFKNYGEVLYQSYGFLCVKTSIKTTNNWCNYLHFKLISGKLKIISLNEWRIEISINMAANYLFVVQINIFTVIVFFRLSTNSSNVTYTVILWIIY